MESTYCATPTQQYTPTVRFGVDRVLVPVPPPMPVLPPRAPVQAMADDSTIPPRGSYVVILAGILITWLGLLTLRCSLGGRPPCDTSLPTQARVATGAADAGLALTTEAKPQLREIFGLCDKSGNGHIHRREALALDDAARWPDRPRTAVGPAPPARHVSATMGAKSTLLWMQATPRGIRRPASDTGVDSGSAALAIEEPGGPAPRPRRATTGPTGDAAAKEAHAGHGARKRAAQPTAAADRKGKRARATPDHPTARHDFFANIGRPCGGGGIQGRVPVNRIVRDILDSDRRRDRRGGA